MPSFGGKDAKRTGPFFLFRLAVPGLSCGAGVRPRLFRPDRLIEGRRVSGGRGFERREEELGVEALRVVVCCVPPALCLPVYSAGSNKRAL